MDEESKNNAVIFKGDMVLDTNNDNQTDQTEQKSNDIDSNKTMKQNDETMVLEVDFCGDGIVHHDKLIDPKTTIDNDGLKTKSNASDKNDMKGNNEEIDGKTNNQNNDYFEQIY